MTDDSKQKDVKTSVETKAFVDQISARTYTDPGARLNTEPVGTRLDTDNNSVLYSGASGFFHGGVAGFVFGGLSALVASAIY